MTFYEAVKLNQYGMVEWQKTHNGAGIDRAGSIKKTNDGGFVITGYTNAFASGYINDGLVLNFRD